MIFSRSLARGAPRALARFSTPAIRQLPSLAQRSAAFPRISAFSGLRSQRAAAGFSTSALRQASSGEVDDELSAKLQSELQFEDEIKENEQLPASVRDFIENSPFEIADIEGQEEVKLTRTFGEEKITITFSIADINFNQDLYEEDRALDDDEDIDAVTSPNKQGGQSAQAEEAGEEGTDGEDGELDDVAAPTRLYIVIEKPGKTPGALSIEATAQDGAIVIDNLCHYADAQVAHGTSSEALRARSDVYAGPPFGNLDEDLQILLERYLEERGVTQALAVFAPDYSDVKEQREYVKWLNNVKGFVDA